MIIICGLAIIILCLIIHKILKSPFEYPYYEYNFDISRKRNPQPEDFLDQFLIDGGFERIRKHESIIQQWKRDSLAQIEKSHLKKYRQKQYEDCLDDSGAYVFTFSRDQTRYSQSNYVRRAYKVKVKAKEFCCSFQWLVNRDQQLRAINYESTLNNYHSKNQRRLLTKDLRKQIMERDHYTCQICGKYMPDGVGLHIDHIIPVSKGGKTVPSNLQVLCSKCNGSKSNKM